MPTDLTQHRQGKSAVVLGCLRVKTDATRNSVMLYASFPSLRRRGNPTFNAVVAWPELNQELVRSIRVTASLAYLLLVEKLLLQTLCPPR